MLFLDYNAEEQQEESKAAVRGGGRGLKRKKSQLIRCHLEQQ